MNIHHLELFYYVARHRGITEAVRNIPYGIQQPAVSGQVAQLEEQLGVTLFQRRPFALTPHGEKLYRFIEPFFANVAAMEGELQGGQARQIRIGASTIVLRDHLPEVLQNVRRKHPRLRISLREGAQAELEAQLQTDELDLAVTVIEKKTAPGIRSVSLLGLPLVLLVAKSAAVNVAEQLWRSDKIDETLICLPPIEAVCKNFQQGLRQRGVDWFPGIEVSSLDLVEAYSACGFGIGLSVVVPKARISPNLRSLPLPDFPPITVGALWRGKTTPVLQAFLEEFQLRAKLLR